VLEVMADAAYSSKENFESADEVGAIPVIAFKKQATGHIGGVYEKMFHIYRMDREEFRKRYNLRNNAESTASMLKRRFRGPLTFRTDPAIENEVLAMVLIHNICCVIQSSFELGIDAEFWA
jgi:transposase